MSDPVPKRRYQQHGSTRHPLYSFWAKGRSEGVLCQRWADDLTTLLADVGDRPDGCWLSRPDLGSGFRCGHAECSECGRQGLTRNWAWMTRSAVVSLAIGVVVEYQGHVRTLSEWSAVTGIPRVILQFRIGSGWSVERALTTPAKKMPPLAPLHTLKQVAGE